MSIDKPWQYYPGAGERSDDIVIFRGRRLLVSGKAGRAGRAWAVGFGLTWRDLPRLAGGPGGGGRRGEGGEAALRPDKESSIILCTVDG